MITLRVLPYSSLPSPKFYPQNPLRTSVAQIPFLCYTFRMAINSCEAAPYSVGSALCEDGWTIAQYGRNDFRQSQIGKAIG